MPGAPRTPLASSGHCGRPGADQLVERHPNVLIGVRVDPDRDPNLTVLRIAAV